MNETNAKHRPKVVVLVTVANAALSWSSHANVCVVER